MFAEFTTLVDDEIKESRNGGDTPQSSMPNVVARFKPAEAPARKIWRNGKEGTGQENVPMPD